MRFVQETLLVSVLFLVDGQMPWFQPVPRISLSPQAILVLGGEPIRERFAAQFALQHRDLPIFVSSGSPEEYARYVFEQAGVSPQRLTLDYRATDTVTNFTTMLDTLSDRQIKSVYVLTSDFHMPRAQMIGSIILGSRGITMHPIAIPSDHASESAFKTLRDGVRSVLWLVTGSPLH